MNEQLIRTILGHCVYPGVAFMLGKKQDVMYLQIICAGACNNTGEPMQWKSRKWLLSEHMVKSEIVQTAFLAVLTAQEHEVRERFTFEDHAIFGPHFNVDRLVTLAIDDARERRQ